MPDSESSADAHLDLFRYLSADERHEYIAVLDRLTSGVLVDMSAGVVAESVDLDVDTVEARCRQLVEWGNLAPSTRDTRVETVADYVRARARYQVTSLGRRVHRGAVEILHATDGAREVTRELLGRIADGVGGLPTLLDAPTPDGNLIAGIVTGVFNDHRLFTESVAEFYAYLADTLGRFDLGGDDYTELKSVLLDYVDLITADVNRHAPEVSAALDRVPDSLFDVLDAVPRLVLTDVHVERPAGRTREEWDGLRRWYAGHGAGSGPAELRAAAGRALGQLLSNAKRILDASDSGFSRRADLLRLASWFDSSSDEDAERLFAATFGAQPTRHLLLGPDEPDPRVGPGTSWWTADPITVPVSLRERGDRVSRGRVSRVPDTTADRRRVDEIARSDALRTRDAAAELATLGPLDGARLSSAARVLLLEQLGRLLAAADDPGLGGQWSDDDLGLRLTATTGADTVVQSPDGTLTVHDLVLAVEPLNSRHADDARRSAR
ncbi:TIGR02677 family protein [Rhodococcoides trifolii]|uniref:TIGR02677 family protein n=1 Tax=Rhodococcoides trifolii TaxID=908250 RepID=A0A917CWK7_9NOCA|nr:TIGR02677 family protein [Rhodococcus trifolii]GGG00225.1 TIGR02677 family protein [Rhodococcus trifolii]